MILIKRVRIGIFELSKKKTNSITKIIQKSKILKKIPYSLKPLKIEDTSLEYMHNTSDLDIFIIEKDFDVYIYIRILSGSRISLECKRFFRNVFIAKNELIIYDLLYRVIELKDFYIYIRNDAGYFRLFFNEISYIEISQRATIIHGANNSLVTYKSLKQYNELLDHRFVRCHASFIVNLDYILTIEYPNIKLMNGQNILLSKHKKHLFFEHYKRYVQWNARHTLPV